LNEGDYINLLHHELCHREIETVTGKKEIEKIRDIGQWQINIATDLMINSQIPQAYRIAEKLVRDREWMERGAIYKPPPEQFKETDVLQIAAISCLKDAALEEKIKKAIEQKVFKPSVTPEKLKEVTELKRGSKLSPEPYFAQKGMGTIPALTKEKVSAVLDLFTDEFKNYLNHLNSKGDGEGDYAKTPSSPDWELKNEILKILKRVLTRNTLETRTNGFSGKKISRDYLEQRPLSILKPLVSIKQERDKNPPSLAIILDGSGSMQGCEESRAKAFLIALLEAGISFDLLQKGEYFEKFFYSFELTVEKIKGLFSTGDEWFNKMDFRPTGYDYLVFITDTKVDDAEGEAIIEKIKRIKHIVINVRNEIKNDVFYKVRTITTGNEREKWLKVAEIFKKMIEK
jgi:hypothetical protein